MSAAPIMWAVFFVLRTLFTGSNLYLWLRHTPLKVKTALGAEAVKWYFKTNEAIGELRKENYRIYSVEQAMNSHPLQQIKFEKNEKLAIIFGNEVTGVEQSTIELTDGCIEIPQLGMKHSLNIATAVGVVLWEMIRTRIPPSPNACA
jgi:tRNA G18 (ribose-2'-O)-methylase SpoU